MVLMERGWKTTQLIEVALFLIKLFINSFMVLCVKDGEEQDGRLFLLLGMHGRRLCNLFVGLFFFSFFFF